MELFKTRQLAEQLMKEHNLEGWNFRFDGAKKRFGQCSCRGKIITLSKHLVDINNEDDIKDTILHEIAHALVGPHCGHDLVWKSKARELGCSDDRCVDTDKINTIEGRFKYKCTHCGRITHYHRIKRLHPACGRCCRLYNNDKYDMRYILVRIK